MADTKEPQARDSSGRFPVGHAGYGGGRKKLSDEVRELLECATPKAAKCWVDALEAVMLVPGYGNVIDHEKRIKAAEKIFDRLYGRPAQAITNDDGTPLFSGGGELLESLRKMTKPTP